MARKPDDEQGAQRAAAERLAETVKASAQQIWLAGLGALSKAQEEGGKVFDALVKEGSHLQQRTQDAAGEKLGEASTRMASMASELSAKASGQWERMEALVEERVLRTLRGLGVPDADEIGALRARVEALERELGRSSPRRTPARAAAGGRAPVRKVAKAATRKRAPARKAGGG